MTPLIEQARDLLSGQGFVPQHSVRAACWVARAALEQRVRELLLAKGLEPGDASMRTLLSCLESAYGATDPGLVAHAEYAWAGLSRASHHHSYELAPVLSEAQHLVDLVGRVGTE